MDTAHHTPYTQHTVRCTHCTQHTTLLFPSPRRGPSLTGQVEMAGQDKHLISAVDEEEDDLENK